MRSTTIAFLFLLLICTSEIVHIQAKIEAGKSKLNLDRPRKKKRRRRNKDDDDDNDKDDKEDDDEEIDLENMSEEDLKKFIESVIEDMVKAGELEPADDFEDDVEVDGDADGEIEIEDDEETSVDELKHLAEDAGKSEAEIAKITEPKKEFKFLADGVVIVD